MVGPPQFKLAVVFALAAAASARSLSNQKRDLQLNADGVLHLKRDGPVVARSVLRKRVDLLSGVISDAATTTAAAATTTAADTTTTAAATTTTITSAAAATTTTEAVTTSAAASSSSDAGTSAAATTTTTSAAATTDTATKSTATSSATSAAATVIITSSIITSLVTNSDGSVSTQTSASVGTSTATAAATSKSSSSSSTGKTWGIVGGVAGGVVALAAIVFIAWKCSQRRFSSLDDDDAHIKWPELQRDGESLNPAGTHRTGGAGFEMGERRASDEWEAQEPFFPPQHDGRASPGYGGVPAAYDPYLGGAGGNQYPPQPAPGTVGGYYNPYEQQAFADSRGNAIGGTSPVPSYAMMGGTDPYADEKEEVGEAPQSRRGSRTLSQMELAPVAAPVRSGTYDARTNF